MMKKRAMSVLWASFLICCCVVPPRSSAQAVPNKRQILSQARQAYYNLRTEGLSEFQCGVTPNWEALLQDQRKQDPKSADAAIETLGQLRFTIKLGADGKIKLTHNELTGQTQQMADALRQIYGGMEQMTSGFFETWALFMLNSPFPGVDSEYQLEARGPQYLLTYKEGTTTDVATTMGRDFAISNLKATTKEFDSGIQPKFAKSPKGLLLTAYDASYKSSSPGETTELRVRIGYQDVGGLQLLEKLNLSGTYGGSPFAVELTFHDCSITKKQ